MAEDGERPNEHISADEQRSPDTPGARGDAADQRTWTDTNASAPTGRLGVVFLFGPTGVGKTDLLLSLFDPDDGVDSDDTLKLPRAEIISADSMQVYRGMDVGTAKPPAELRARLPHHLIDIHNPDEQYHAGDFVAGAEAAAREISARGNLPVVSGGTAFYFRNLLYGLPGTPRSDPEIPAELYRRAIDEGRDSLVRELQSVDPDSAKRIAPADLYRIVRAIEVFRSTGKPLSAYNVPVEPRTDFDALIIGIVRPGAELRERIARRVDQMFTDGLIEEVRGLLASGLQPKAPGLRGIGYREIVEAFGSGLDPEEESTAAGLRVAIALHTRQYAKRQLTFFRRIPNVRWVDMSSPGSRAPVVEVKRAIADFLRRKGAD